MYTFDLIRIGLGLVLSGLQRTTYEDTNSSSPCTPAASDHQSDNQNGVVDGAEVLQRHYQPLRHHAVRTTTLQKCAVVPRRARI